VVGAGRWRRVVQLTVIIAGVVLLAFVVRYDAPARHAITRTYTTRAGQSADVTLDDGTHVMMAPRSTLRLVQFGADRRTVVLDGEAYFDVAHAGGAPFTVQAGGVSTRVLGTAFLVRHYGGDRVVRVAVASGRVGVTMPRWQTPSVLVASDVGEIGDSTITFHSVTNLDADAQWVGGRLVFTNVPVEDVLAALTRWYGYEFRFADSTIARQNVTVWLSTRSSATALATLERLLDVSLTVAGDTVTLTPRRGAQGQGMTRVKSYDVWTPTREVGR
jgi:transmembrane sensor